MTATAPELSKSDFFDFVTSNEVTDAQYKQQMRSVSLFMESPVSRSNPLLSDEPKEQNNNNLLSNTSSQASVMASATATSTLQSFDSIWNVDRDRDRIENAMLEDLSNYWSQDAAEVSNNTCDTSLPSKLIGSNTDGQIYTLTVLNQDINEPTSNRYWSKEEDVPISSPTDMDQQPSLDLESILNMNGFPIPNDFHQDSLNTNILAKVENFEYEEVDVKNENSDLITTDLVKAESFKYEDSNEYSSNDGKDVTIIATPVIESQIEFNNNNNDWKLTDQNAESNESLLRSALQGKAFIRYTTQKTGTVKLDGNIDLKRAIITNNNKSDVPSMYQDNDQEYKLLMSMPEDGTTISILLDDNNTTVITRDPSSTQNVDDLLLSQLDNTYPDDYEKLKRIASELGESVQPFCTVEPIDPSRNVYNIQQVNGELVTMIPTGEIQIPHHLQIVTASPTVTSSKTVTKKYKRVQNKTIPTTTQNQTGTAIQPATSTSNGVRKERSLHYCSICSKGFKDKYSVNVHVRTHTGEKPFACSLCGKSFRQKAHLAKHYQTHIAQKAAAANGTLKTKQR